MEPLVPKNGHFPSSVQAMASFKPKTPYPAWGSRSEDEKFDWLENGPCLPPPQMEGEKFGPIQVQPGFKISTPKKLHLSIQNVGGFFLPDLPWPAVFFWFCSYSAHFLQLQKQRIRHLQPLWGKQQRNRTEWDGMCVCVCVCQDFF